MPDLLSVIHSNSFYEFAVLLALAGIAGLIGTLLRQPLIIAFIVIGVLVGPSAFGIVQSGDEVALLAKLGIAILLFIVGLKLDLGLIRSLGTVSVIVGLTQIVLTVGGGVLICLYFGLALDTAFMIGVAMAFSSTIIIVKLLSDKREIDSLHGRIALGVLIIQDLAVVLSMIVMATIGAGAEQGGNGQSLLMALLQVAGTTVLLLIFLALFMRFASMKIMSYVAKNKELLLSFAIAWAVMLAALCDVMGLSKELGGLLAGVSLASTPYREAVISRLASLRDFLLLFFFIALGTQIDLALLGGMIAPAIALSIFVMLFKPLIILSMTGLLGYRKRTGFLAGLSLAQISEFSLIFISMAFSLNMVTQDVLGLVTLVGLITIITSTYLLSMSQQIYNLVEPALGIFERRTKYQEQKDDTAKPRRAYDVILFGLGRYGRAMAESFIQEGKTVLSVDFNPDVVKNWRNKGYDAVFGDASDPEFFHTLPLKNSKWVISALPQKDVGITHEDPRLIILSALKENNFQGHTALAVHHIESVDKFKKAGADVIFLPFHDAAERAVTRVLEIA